MKWIIPEHSKKRVKRAGELLVSDSQDQLEIDESMDVLSNWRSIHAYPMHAMLIWLRKKVSDVDTNGIVVQRLKRTPSILGKLKRFGQMKLHRMQDIGGLRAVMSNVTLVETLHSNLISGRSRHTLHKVDNYIENPKESGYRGIHIVYKYNGAKEEYKDLFVEIQLRSKIQHSWATAVEIIDTFTNQALKASHGEDKWLEFFKYASAEFSKLEKRPVGEHLQGVNTLELTKTLAKELSVIEKLNAFALSSNTIAKKQINKSDYFILELIENASMVRIHQYPQSQLKEATENYLNLERKAAMNSNYDAVLVSANSIANLKKAYPNYFADSKDFLKNLRRICDIK